jgi:hypothetical protein
VQVPMGFTSGLPMGISFYASAFSEPKLIELASGFEAATQARRKPEFLSTLSLNGKKHHRRGRKCELPNEVRTTPRRM